MNECDVCGPTDEPTVQGVIYDSRDLYQDGEGYRYQLCEYHYIYG